MLAEPTIDTVVEKSGKNRYETSILVAKRAREISAKRLETDSDEILEPVEVATYELVNGDIEFVNKEDLEKAEEEVEEIELDKEEE